MTPSDELPPVISIAGKKNSGKTTFFVALAAELKRRGYRVASVKHGHPHFEFDQPGRDSWRHFHEGEVEAVLIASSNRIAMVKRVVEDPEPEQLVRDYLTGQEYDLVLIEGYKYGPFPKIEIFRREQHEQPVYDPTDAVAAGRFIAIVTDDSTFRAPFPVIELDAADPAGTHVAEAANLVETRLRRRST